MTHASYMREVFNPEDFEIEVNRVSEIIKQKFPEIDYIAGSGISGITMASAVAFNLKKHIYIVRKMEDTTHSRIYSKSERINGGPKLSEFADIEKTRKYAIIVDDLISSGTTMKRVANEILLNKIKIKAAILYHETAYNGKEFSKEPGLDFPVFSTSQDID